MRISRRVSLKLSGYLHSAAVGSAFHSKRSDKILVVSLLELRDVSITAGGKILLRGVNLSLQRGEIVALCGPSGLGKTTLLRAIAGLDDAAAGTISLEEKSPDEWTYPAFRRRVMLVEQRPVVFDCSIEENLRRPFHYHAASFPFPVERARDLITLLQMPDASKRRERCRKASNSASDSFAPYFCSPPFYYLMNQPAHLITRPRNASKLCCAKKQKMV